MALVQSYTTPFGIEVPAAYVKVASVSADKHVITINVEWYATQAARDAGSPVMASHSFAWQTPEAAALIGLCYEHLKTLPDFAGATDV